MNELNNEEKSKEIECRVWDYTRLETFKTCPRKYYYRMYLGLTPMHAATPLRFGLAVHSALESFYSDYKLEKPRLWETRMEEAIKVFVDSYEADEGEARRTVANGINMLEVYFKLHQQEPFKVTATELGFVVMLGPYFWGGRIDAIAEWDGQVYAIEHKTTSILGISYFNQFRLSHQIHSYTYGIKETLGKECAGVLLNALEIWKPPLRKTAKSKLPSEHFARDILTKSAEQVEEFKVEAESTITDIISREMAVLEGGSKHEFFPCSTGACFNYYTFCPYAQLCQHGETEFDLKKFKTETWAPYKVTKDNTEGDDNDV